jgi:hypothetical protein
MVLPAQYRAKSLAAFVPAGQATGRTPPFGANRTSATRNACQGSYLKAPAAQPLRPSSRTHRAITLTRENAMDPIRRNILAAGAAAAATAAAPHVFAQPIAGKPGRDVRFRPRCLAKEFRERRPEVSIQTIEKYLHSLTAPGLTSCAACRASSCVTVRRRCLFCPTTRRHTRTR